MSTRDYFFTEESARREARRRTRHMGRVRFKVTLQPSGMWLLSISTRA